MKRTEVMQQAMEPNSLFEYDENLKSKIHFELEQRSEDWFKIRLGKFTSSSIYKLMPDATKEKRAQEALKVYQNYHLKVTASAAEINFACKKLNFTTKEAAQAKKDCKLVSKLPLEEGDLKIAKENGLFNILYDVHVPDLTELSEKVFRFCCAMDLVFVFSDGAESYILEKASEFIFSEKQSDFVNDAMLWGIENEDLAIKTYLKRNQFYDAKECGFIELGKDTGSSPDRLIMEWGMVEAKCPSQINHLKNIIKIKSSNDLREVHPKYWYQIQHQLYCSKRDWCDFISFHPNLLDGPYSALALHSVRVEKDIPTFYKFKKILPLAAKKRDEYIDQLIKSF